MAAEGEGALAGRRACKRIQRATFCKKAKTYLKRDHLGDEIFPLLLPLNLLQNSNTQFFRVSASLPPLPWRTLSFCVNTGPVAGRSHPSIEQSDALSAANYAPSSQLWEPLGALLCTLPTQGRTRRVPCSLLFIAFSSLPGDQLDVGEENASRRGRTLERRRQARCQLRILSVETSAWRVWGAQ